MTIPAKTKRGRIEWLIRRAEDLLAELAEYDMPQYDENDEFGPGTCVGELREAVKEIRTDFPNPDGILHSRRKGSGQ